MLLGSNAAFILFIVLSDSMPNSFSRYCRQTKVFINNYVIIIPVTNKEMMSYQKIINKQRMMGLETFSYKCAVQVISVMTHSVLMKWLAFSSSQFLSYAIALKKEKKR